MNPHCFTPTQEREGERIGVTVGTKRSVEANVVAIGSVFTGVFLLKSFFQRFHRVRHIVNPLHLLRCFLKQYIMRALGRGSCIPHLRVGTAELTIEAERQ